MTEGQFPKVDGNTWYASEVNFLVNGFKQEVVDARLYSLDPVFGLQNEDLLIDNFMDVGNSITGEDNWYDTLTAVTTENRTYYYAKGTAATTLTSRTWPMNQTMNKGIVFANYDILDVFDDFDDESVDTGLWDTSTTGNGEINEITANGGSLVLDCASDPNNNGSSTVRQKTGQGYDNGDVVFVNLTVSTSGSPSGTATFKISDGSSSVTIDSGSTFQGHYKLVFIDDRCYAYRNGVYLTDVSVSGLTENLLEFFASSTENNTEERTMSVRYVRKLKETPTGSLTCEVTSNDGTDYYSGDFGETIDCTNAGKVWGVKLIGTPGAGEGINLYGWGVRRIS